MSNKRIPNGTTYHLDGGTFSMYNFLSVSCVLFITDAMLGHIHLHRLSSYDCAYYLTTTKKKELFSTLNSCEFFHRGPAFNWKCWKSRSETQFRQKLTFVVVGISTIPIKTMHVLINRSLLDTIFTQHKNCSWILKKTQNIDWNDNFKCKKFGIFNFYTLIIFVSMFTIFWVMILWILLSIRSCQMVVKYRMRVKETTIGVCIGCEKSENLVALHLQIKPLSIAWLYIVLYT